LSPHQGRNRSRRHPGYWARRRCWWRAFQVACTRFRRHSPKL